MRTLSNILLLVAFIVTALAKNYLALVWIANTAIWCNLYYESNK